MKAPCNKSINWLEKAFSVTSRRIIFTNAHLYNSLEAVCSMRGELPSMYMSQTASYSSSLSFHPKNSIRSRPRRTFKCHVSYVCLLILCL